MATFSTVSSPDSAVKVPGWLAGGVESRKLSQLGLCGLGGPAAVPLEDKSAVSPSPGTSTHPSSIKIQRGEKFKRHGLYFLCTFVSNKEQHPLHQVSVLEGEYTVSCPLVSPLTFPPVIQTDK